MSFDLYGPVATLEDEVWKVALAGDKLLAYIQSHVDYMVRESLYDMNFNKVAEARIIEDCDLIRYHAVHRHGKLPELYSGITEYGYECTCPASPDHRPIEIVKYTFGSSTVDVRCLDETAVGGMIDEMYYDVVTRKLVVNTSFYENKLYLVDPDTGEARKWQSASMNILSTKVVVYDDKYLYVLLSKEEYGGASRYGLPSGLEIRRFETGEFYNAFGSGNIEDYGELIYREEMPQYRAPEAIMLTLAPNKPLILLESLTEAGNGRPACYGYDPVSNEFVERHPCCPDKRYFGKYTLRESVVYDIEANTDIQVIEDPPGTLRYWGWWRPAVDPIFEVCYTLSPLAWYIYLLRYNGVAPVIEYDHLNRKIRVVDFVTKNPLPAELWVWRSRFCYPRDAYPLGIAPETLSVSDWTPVPSALKTECLTFAIKSVEVG
ncbi:MAG: hypothetical protein QW503_02265 [Sulfolobales archaeon]